MSAGILAFDIETTGLDFDNPGIVQAAYILRRPDGDDVERKTLADPGFPIPKEATRVHGIGDEHVNGCVTSLLCARRLRTVIGEALSKGMIPTAYNGHAFDVPYINAVLRKGGIDDVIDKDSVFDPSFFARWRYPHLGWRLTDVYARITGREAVNAHDALGDCAMLVDVAVATLHDVEDWRHEQAVISDALEAEWIMYGGWCYERDEVVYVSKGKYRGARVDEVPNGYLEWLQRTIESDIKKTANKGR